MTRALRRLRAPRGFTIIEVMISAAIMILGVTAIASAYGTLSRMIVVQHQIVTATQIAEKNLEQIIASSRGDISDLYTPLPGSDYLWMQYDMDGRLLKNYGDTPTVLHDDLTFRTTLTRQAGPINQTEHFVFSVLWPKSGSWPTPDTFYRVKLETYVNAER